MNSDIHETQEQPVEVHATPELPLAAPKEEPKPKSRSIVAFWMYMTIGFVLLSAWVYAGFQSKPRFTRTEAVAMKKAPPKVTTTEVRPPPAATSSGKKAEFGQWLNKGDIDVYYVSLQRGATIRSGRFIWANAFSSYFFPLGVSVYNEIPFNLHDDGSIIVLPTAQEPMLSRISNEIRVPLSEPYPQAEHAFLLGLIAGWGGDIADAFGPSARLIFTFESPDTVKTYDIYACDIWEQSHQLREKEKNNLRATAAFGIHIDMRGFKLDGSEKLTSIILKDTNEVDSLLVMAITLMRKATREQLPPYAVDEKKGDSEE